MLSDSSRGGPAKLRAQLSTSAASISDNIAEGAGRNTPTEKAAKFRIARGEVEEAQNQLQRWYEAGMVSEKRYLNLMSLAICIDRMLTKLILKNERAAVSSPRRSRKRGEASDD